MTEQDFLDLITKKDANFVLKELAKVPAKERRAFAKPAMTLFKKLDRFWILADSLPDPKVKDGEAVTVAMLATASASELKKLSFFPKPSKVSLVDIVRAIDPDWLQAVVDHFVEDRVLYVGMFQPLWKAGLCERPTGDGIILHYYSRWAGSFLGHEQAELLGGDVWRFFEVEGGGEDSLANHDKYLKKGQLGWAERLKNFSEDGTLDRQRLLDASLDALERDFAQYRAGWYSRFHVLMQPNADEMAARSDRYLRLLASSIPPTVSFALKHLQALEKAGVLDPSDLITALEPALQARAKGTVTTSLKLLQSAAKRQPDLREVAASKAVLALISEDAGVQEAALDAIEALGAGHVAGDLAGYVDMVAPSVRPRIAALVGVSSQSVSEPAPDVAPLEAEPIMPVDSAEAALALFLSVLEDPRNPFEVERAIDGISRFGLALRADEHALSPLRKRAKQVCSAPGESDIRFVLALSGRAFAEGVDLKAVLRQESNGSKDFNFVPPLSLQEAHLERNKAVLARLADHQSLPMLSLPSDTSGCVHVDDLFSRLESYRAAAVEPDETDLALAFMRLDTDRGQKHNLPTDTEVDRAVAYALDEHVKVGPTPELWAAAWIARDPKTADPSVSKLFKEPTPGCGIPAIMTLKVGRKVNGPYAWIDTEVPISPENQIKSRALPALFWLNRRKHFDDSCCGHTFADIAWASITWPANVEPFFRIGIIVQDTWQKLSDNPTRAYLEPFFRPGPSVGQLGAGLLAYYMACEDKSVSSLAIEATATLALQERLTAEGFSSGLKPFLMSNTLPTSRWTKALKEVAGFGASGFARKVITNVMDFPPEQTPRDIGGMLELCYELHLADNAALQSPAAVACLKAIPGGGKAARFRKKLLALAK